MQISKKRLKTLIKEELQRFVEEEHPAENYNSEERKVYDAITTALTNNIPPDDIAQMLSVAQAGLPNTSSE